jgi:hypothetical protein
MHEGIIILLSKFRIFDTGHVAGSQSSRRSTQGVSGCLMSLDWWPVHLAVLRAVWQTRETWECEAHRGNSDHGAHEPIPDNVEFTDRMRVQELADALSALTTGAANVTPLP